MRIVIIVDTGFAGAKHEEEVEIDDLELAGMSEEQKADYITQEYVNPFMHDRIEAWYEEIED